MDERQPTASEAVTSYLRDRQLGGAPRSSITTYRGSLRLLTTDESVAALAASIRDRLYERCQSVAPNTAIAIISTHRSFVRYCLARGWLLADPLAGVSSPRKREVPHRFLSADEARTVWLAADDLLDRAALILLSKGLRAGEACGVRWTDVRRDDDGAYLAVRTEKGGPARLMPLTDAESALLAALPHRAEEVLGVGRQALWKRIQRLGRRCGVPLHPHLFRHTWAMSWLEATGDQGTLQTLGGWRSESMPRYYSRSALERVALKRARQADVRLFGADNVADNTASAPDTPQLRTFRRTE